MYTDVCLGGCLVLSRALVLSTKKYTVGKRMKNQNTGRTGLKVSLVLANLYSSRYIKTARSKTF